MPEVKRKGEPSVASDKPTKTEGKTKRPSSDQASETSNIEHRDERTKLSPAAKDVEQAVQNSAQAKTKVETRIDEMTISLTLADDELTAKEKEIESNVGTANQEIALMKESAKTSVENIETEVKVASDELNQAFAKLRLASRVAPIVLSIVYYGVYLAQYGFAYNPSIYGGISIAVVLALLLKVILDRVYFNVETAESQALEQMKMTRQGLGGLLATKLAIEPNLKRVKDNFTRVASYGQVILSSMRDYIPALEKAYATRDRMNRQLVFLKSLRNALVTYGFEIKGTASDYLSSFGPLTESTNEWLDEAAAKMQPMLGVSRQLLSLMFFDYVGDSEGKKNVWSGISHDAALIKELSKTLISNSVVNTEYLEKNLENYGAVEELISGDKPFGLDAFKIAYTQYYVDYAREKRTTIDALRMYRIDVSERTETSLLKYDPTTFLENERKQQLFAEATKLTGAATEVVGLAYFERTSESDARIQVWNNLRGQAKILADLVTRLVAKNILDVPSNLDKRSAQVQTFVIRVVERLQDFTLNMAQESVRKSFDESEDLKEIFLRTISGKIILDETQRRELGQWLPTEIKPSSIADWLGLNTGVPQSIFLLFYYDYTQDRKNRKLGFDEIRRNGNVGDLARVLLEKGFIKLAKSEREDLEGSIRNLSSLLLQIEDYDRSEIQAMFSTYNQLLNFAQGLLDFCMNQEIVVGGLSPTFDQVLKAVGLEEKETLARLELILNDILSEHGPRELKSPDWSEHVVKATLTFYLVSRQNTLSPAACTNAGSDDLSAKILYQFSRVNEDEEQKGALTRTKFGMIIRRTIDGTFTDYEYLESFKKELVGGFMYFRISHMLEARLQIIRHAVQERNEIEQKFQQYDDAFNTLLETKFRTTNIVLESLQMNLVKAYVITNPSQADVITGIIAQLPTICSELATGDSTHKGDARYKDFVLTSERSFGKATRIGIVPFGMEFKEFGDLFENAFQITVRRSGAKHRPSEYVGNVIRIFPSSAYFKRVEGLPRASAEHDEDDPIGIITELVMKHYKHLEKFELMASLHGDPEKTVALKRLLTSSIDESTTLYLMAEDQFSAVSGSKFYDDLRTGKVDQDLMANFRKETRSDLALAVFKASGRNGENAAAVKGKIAEYVDSLAKQTGARLGENLTPVSNVIYQVLFDTGFLVSKFVQ